MNPIERRSRLTGSVVGPGEDGWGQARAAWNLVVNQHPAAVAYVESAEDVAAVVDFAREAGLRLAPQGTGHGAGSRGALDGTILLKTERMNGVEIDPESGVGGFEAGVIWRDAGDAAAEHRFAVMSGSSPDVGVVGYTTGGGLGWLSRRYGLACNNVGPWSASAPAMRGPRSRAPS